MSLSQRFRHAIARDKARHDKAESAPRGPFGLLFYGGTLGLLFIVPVVGGAYLGRWIDAQLQGYSVRWTLSMVILGIVTGFWNVMRFMRQE